jgi:hypothetical protein
MHAFIEAKNEAISPPPPSSPFYNPLSLSLLFQHVLLSYLCVVLLLAAAVEELPACQRASSSSPQLSSQGGSDNTSRYIKITMLQVYYWQVGH